MAILSRKAAFKLMNLYSTLWMAAKSKVVLRGLENLSAGLPGERRVYVLVNHETTYDVVALMHISKSPFVVMMDKGAFTFPIIGKLLRRAGFVPLEAGNSGKAVEECVEQVRGGQPLLISLHAGDSTIGTWGRPRTGGVRIAHMTGATIYPVYLKVEADRMRHLRFKGVNGVVYPYTTFRNSLYFIEFLPPVSLADLPANAGHGDFAKIAERLDHLADSVDHRYNLMLSEDAAAFASVRRRGGTSERIDWTGGSRRQPETTKTGAPDGPAWSRIQDPKYLFKTLDERKIEGRA